MKMKYRWYLRQGLTSFELSIIPRMYLLNLNISTSGVYLIFSKNREWIYEREVLYKKVFVCLMYRGAVIENGTRKQYTNMLQQQ